MNITSYKRTVTTAGTAVRLATSSLKVQKAAIKALSTNSGLIYIGKTHNADDVSSSDGFELSAKEALSLDPYDVRGQDTVIDLYDIWIDAATNGEGVTVIFGTAPGTTIPDPVA